jgi:hypothetical protein
MTRIPIPFERASDALSALSMLLSMFLSMSFAIPLLAGPAAAHTQSGSLGAEASATDLFQVVCSNDGTGAPGSLSVQILDDVPAAAPKVGVQVRGGLLLATSTDAVDGDTTPSPLIHVDVTTTLVFDVLVDKTGAGSENYVLTYHCVTGPNGTGLHTGTALVTRQNQ